MPRYTPERHPGPAFDALAAVLGVVIGVGAAIRFGWPGALVAGVAGLTLGGLILLVQRLRYGRWTP